VANLKPCAVSWIGTLFENPHPPLPPTSKGNRGFEHDITGRLLCPINYNWDNLRYMFALIDQSQDMRHVIYTTLSDCQNIKDGHPNFSVTGDFWPAFLYPHTKGDPEDAEKGLFKSYLLVKVFT
jgi:hypothetical protein